MTGPSVKGWCPGAHRPMLSGDGLVVRVRPRGGRITPDQALGLCDLARRHGSGLIDLTRRANLQIRGVADAAHPALLRGLDHLDLLDHDPEMEARRNIITTPFGPPGDLSRCLTEALIDALPRLPALPAKVGFAVDCGETRCLTEDPADLRLERCADGGLLLRADGAAGGRAVTPDTAIPALMEMADWLATRIAPDARRMRAVLRRHPLPPAWQGTAPAPRAARPVPGPCSGGTLLGAPFGQIAAEVLQDLLQDGFIRDIRITPWRMILVDARPLPPSDAFITTPDDPLLTADACPGAPYCPASSVETRAIARRHAPRIAGGLHVSGCAKGCARGTPAAVTLVGRDGRFDLVRDGCAWDDPEVPGLAPDALEATL